MSAPKPMVTPVAVPLFGATCEGPQFDRHTFWTWRCSCGELPIYGYDIARFPSQAAACDAATRHSRTHTAERVADELDRLFDAYQGAAVFASDHTRSMFYRGKREGTLDAARLIRTHLV